MKWICPKCGTAHAWTGVCDPCLDALRPTPATRIDSMINKRKTKRTLSILVAAIVLLIVALAASPPAKAHTALPSSCTPFWQAAPPGQRWPVKQRCLAAIVRHNCVKHPRPVPGYVTVKGLKLMPGRRRGNSVHWRNQRKVIGWIVNEGLRRHLRYKVVLSALAATTQESSARELDHGHSSSVGPFQLISSHGSAKDRQTIEFSGNWYFNGALKILRGNPSIGAAQLSQAVERSGFPRAYATWIPESRRTLNAVLGPCRLRR